jgi:chorismate mutase
MRADDLLFVLLIGHGSFDGTDAKFNLVGPDLSSVEWAALLKPLPGQVVVVNTTAASFPFLERLAAPRRIVLTSTDSVAQRFDTVFPEHFIRALTDGNADLDKNGRVSVWEAFAAASMGVRRYYTQRGQLATEHALIDDNGDGVGREAGGEGTDGSMSSRLYLDPEVAGSAPTDEELLQLLQKRAGLQIDVDELKQRRQLMTPDEYEKEFERIMLALATVSRDIRRKQKT